MIKTINGALFRAMIDSGIRNLALHGKEVNDLNVFPVPDGDTGTNMVLTLRNGFGSIENKEACPLPDMAKTFSSAVVYGARGNSGVIVSRFFKGFADTFVENGEDSAETEVVLTALRRGTDEAYRAVTRPTEGTMLTVLRESTEKVEHTFRNVDCGLKELISTFLNEARIILQHTPELLAVLKDAGVVDSGGAGVVYVFEGFYKYLCGEAIEVGGMLFNGEKAVDYSKFNSKSSFDYGYCTEFLLQLTENAQPFDADDFKAFLESSGDSVAATFELDKVKVHVHTTCPEIVMAEAHKYGEFLSLKIENMSVQHTEIAEKRATEAASVDIDGDGKEAVLCLPEERKEADVGVVVCAPDHKTAELFHSMGADAVLCCPAGISPTTQDFVNAIEAIGTSSAVIFPNNGNNILSAQKTSEMLGEKISVEVVPSRSVAECYSALAMIDYEESAENIAHEAVQVIERLYNVTVMQAIKDAVFGDVKVNIGDYIAMYGSKLVAADEELWELVKRIMNGFVELEGREPDTVTVFTGKNTPEGLSDMICKRVECKYEFTEADVVVTDSETYDLILSFE